jgi:hypothetical protein
MVSANHRRRRVPPWLAIGLAVLVAVVGGAVAIRLTATAPPTSSAGTGSPGSVTAAASLAPATVTPSVSTSAGPSASTRPPVAPPPRPPTGTSAKKGVSTWEFSGVGAALRDVKAAWYYNWAAGPTNQAGSTAEFVPMIWGPGSVTAANLNKAKASGTVLLGFNEPDFAQQANLTVERALDLWPQLQATGLRLGSPAPAINGAKAGDWLDRFMTGAKARGYRVDFIALHWYGSDFSTAAVGHLRSYLQAVYDRYHLPIWLTEYALINFGGGQKFPSPDQQAAFVTASTTMLAGLSFVQRYAWFALPADDGSSGCGLYRAGPQITPVGQAFKQAR